MTRGTLLSSLIFTTFFAVSAWANEADFTGFSPCEGSRSANYYTCNKVDLLSQININTLGLRSESGNDIWGWEDPNTGEEFAIMGLSNKTAFVNITDPSNPVYIGDLKTKTVASIWRDIKVYKNHAYIVSEASGHGLQVFDLMQLKAAKSHPVQFTEAAYYGNFGSAHNIFINEDTGYAYVVGSDTCDAGIHMVDIRKPTEPKFVGCIDKAIFEDVKPIAKSGDEFMNDLFEVLHGEDYTHDVQCVIYKGPDVRFHGHEICVASNADTVNIVDVTDKANPVQIAVTDYANTGYTHQGWLSKDQRFFLLGDELDEMKLGVNTTTIVWDLADLTNPVEHHRYVSTTKSIDHNMYVRGNYVYQANYLAGLRILDISDVANKNVTEAAFFDTNPNEDKAKFDGIWSVYPFFNSNSVVLSGINGHLYIVRPNL